MRKRIVYRAALLSFAVIVSSASFLLAQTIEPNNTITLITYYPAPFGAYKKMTISDSVGIGTTSPKAPLHLSKALANPTVFENDDVGQLNVSGTSTSSGEFAKITFNNPYSAADETVGVAAIGSIFNAVGSSLYFGTSDAYSFGVTNSALVIDPAGNVGIGMAGPNARLDVKGAGIPAPHTGLASATVMTSTRWQSQITATSASGRRVPKPNSTSAAQRGSMGSGFRMGRCRQRPHRSHRVTGMGMNTPLEVDVR